MIRHLAKHLQSLAMVLGVPLALVVALQVLGHSSGEARADDNPSNGKEQVFDIVLHRGKRVSGPAVLEVHQGDEVTLHITTDTADEFHLHGYNLLVQLLPNKTAALHFLAKLTGRFTYELHRSDLELGALEVYPR
jgi:hypothetical protein